MLGPIGQTGNGEADEVNAMLLVLNLWRVVSAAADGSLARFHQCPSRFLWILWK